MKGIKIKLTTTIPGNYDSATWLRSGKNETVRFASDGRMVLVG